MASQSYQTLDPAVIQRVLEGRESILEKISEQDQEGRETILREKCPHCNGHLVPRLPRDITKAFSGPNLRHVPWCPVCRKEVTGA